MIFRQLFDHTSSTYTYLISSGRGREALIIDPVLENVDRYLKLIHELDLKLVKVIDTHIHADHISGMAELRDKTNCTTIMGDKTQAEVASMSVSDGETIKIEDINLKSLYTPGHTSDSFSFLMNDRVFTGDLLLIRGTGRTDFQNGNPSDSYDSIFNILLKLPEKTLVYPAHDYKGDMVSTIEEEKKFNPRLQVKSKNEYADLMNNLNLPDPKMMDVAIPGNLKLGIDTNKQKINYGLSPEQFTDQISKNNSLIIDLREETEIKKDGKIKNSKNVSFEEISEYLSNKTQELKDKIVLFYCAVGHRSTLAVQISASYGYKNTYHLIGGIKNWKISGFEVESYDFLK